MSLKKTWLKKITKLCLYFINYGPPKKRYLSPAVNSKNFLILKNKVLKNIRERRTTIATRFLPRSAKNRSPEPQRMEPADKLQVSPASYTA